MPGVPKRVIVERRNGRLGGEEQMIVDEAHRRKIPVEELTEKILSRGFCKFEPTDLVVGSVKFIKHALRLLDAPLVEASPYPECLRPYLGRAVGRYRSLKEVKHELDLGYKWFVKPVDTKIFTGFVPDSSTDFRFNGVSNRRPMYVSEVVEFHSEWRYYVVDGQPKAMRWYAGDKRRRPNQRTVYDAIEAYAKAGAPAGYVIDFGVIDRGETVLIEVNDGFAVGAYCESISEVYWDMLVARWQELIGVRWGE